jgi:hypothetical protein
LFIPSPFLPIHIASTQDERQVLQFTASFIAQITVC